MITDYSEYRSFLRRELKTMINTRVGGLYDGAFATISDFEKARGAIDGLKLALELIEDNNKEE